MVYSPGMLPRGWRQTLQYDTELTTKEKDALSCPGPTTDADPPEFSQRFWLALRVRLVPLLIERVPTGMLMHQTDVPGSGMPWNSVPEKFVPVQLQNRPEVHRASADPASAYAVAGTSRAAPAVAATASMASSFLIAPLHPIHPVDEGA
ncbi:hypothetical protein [Micromonospora sp. LOL_015]|uniref:hypothetical protein n=1 Tax=Micromonospora sp. LOL_015 TaxID=3345416 RepID=UPI003A842223